MVRSFKNHRIRKSRELSSDLWEFHALEGNLKDKKYQVFVPSCWENYPGFESYRGKGMYARDFEGEGTFRLEFKGVSHTAEIYVDGKKVGEHYNAYTPFEVLVRDLEPGVHRLEVAADNSFSEKSALHVPNDYKSYGGISRAVVLEDIEKVYIKWVHFTPVWKQPKQGEEKQWFCNIAVCVRNISQNAFEGSIEIELAGKKLAELQVSLKGEETGRVETGEILCGDMEMWCPENPKLYELNTVLKDWERVEIDDCIERVGFREIQINGKDILLNGKKIFIKGLCRHEDHPHFVWEENHARGLSEEQMRNPHFEKQCETCIREMITVHYNHPSIYIWGILNECASNTEYGESCYRQQYELIRTLDSSRPRSSASCQFKTDRCFGYPEVVSYNIYPLWYHDTPPKEYLEDLYQWVQSDTEGRGKPFMITEIGAGAVYGYRHPDHVKWTEEYQAEALEKQIQAVAGQEGCSGIYIWQFCDTRISEEWFGTRPKTMNNKGVVDEYRRRKQSYDIVKKLYAGIDTYLD